MSKKILVIVCFVFFFFIGYFVLVPDNRLPKPEVTGGERGMLGIDKNINEKTIDKYLNRSDSCDKDLLFFKELFLNLLGIISFLFSLTFNPLKLFTL